MLDSKRRTEIERLLTIRGKLLSPREKTISRALRRCVKHSANFSPEDEPEHSETDPTDDLSAEGTGPIPTEALDEIPIQSKSEEFRIATAVAHAVTVTESKSR